MRQEKGGKHVGKSKGKGKTHKDSDSNPSVVSRDVLEHTVIGVVGVGELATKKRNVGLKKNTQRAIHHKTHYKETFVKGRTQRRKGKVTASPKEKVKVKVKAKARENIQEKGTTTRTRLDLQKKKVDSAGWMFSVLNVRESNLLVMSKSRMIILKCPEWIEQLTSFVFNWPEMPSSSW